MSTSGGILAFHNREAVKVKARVSAATLHRRSQLAPSDPPPAEWRRFSVDPQITTFEVLQNLLAKAFDIKGDFTIHYLAKDDEGKETYLGLLSDWDLDAAFLSSSMPCLNLLIDLKPFEEENLMKQLLMSAQLRLKPGVLHFDPLNKENLSLEGWDVITPADLVKPPLVSHVRNNAQQTGNFLMQQLCRVVPSYNTMEKTLKSFSKVLRGPELSGYLNAVAERYRASKPPMSKREWQNFLDCEGRLMQPQELRRSVFRGGIEPSLRNIVWKHVLNVYPDDYTKDQRVQYLKRKANEYYKLKATWTEMQKQGIVTEEMQYIMNMVSKDVLRTDRTHRFYAGSDDNKNVAKLYYILTTFALNHPSVSYCQGMSDLASPMLVTMNDEAQAYICFVALMQRMKPNFNINGLAITEKFAHLSLLLQHYDPEFFEYLKMNGADDLLYCYRWLLLELKREFSFDDALCMLEVLWSSLPPSPPDKELPLYEIRFGRDSAHPQSPRIVHTRENPYTKVRRIRKQSSSSSLLCGTPKVHNGVIVSEAGNDDSRRSSLNEITDDSQDYNPISDSITHELRMDLENLNKTVLGNTKDATPQQFTFDNIIEEGNTLLETDGPWKLRKTSQGYCGTPDEQCDLDFDNVDGETTHIQGNRRNLSCQSSLDRRRSGSSTSASTSGSSHSDLLQDKVDDSDYEDEHHAFRAKPPPSHSEGYCSEATLSSKEVSCQEDTRSVLDSGVLEFSRKSRSLLPPPGQLGGSNPFMMFLCLTLLLQHRDFIIRNRMDYNELAMHFDKMVRKHNVHKVLHETRIRFEEYLRLGWEASWEELV